MLENDNFGNLPTINKRRKGNLVTNQIFQKNNSLIHQINFKVF